MHISSSYFNTLQHIIWYLISECVKNDFSSECVKFMILKKEGTKACAAQLRGKKLPSDRIRTPEKKREPAIQVSSIWNAYSQFHQARPPVLPKISV